jgi:DNA-binding CsgD family transcriptional regulator
MKELQLPNSPNLFLCAKDTQLRFIACNENFARIADADSPQQLIGKDDTQLIWRSQASIFRSGDIAVLRGATFLNVAEKQIQVDKTADILVTKSLLKSHSGKVCGTLVSYIDITGYVLIPKIGEYKEGRLHFKLNGISTYFTPTELNVFKAVLLGKPASQIAIALQRSKRTIEGHINVLKQKLQVSNKVDIIKMAWELGLSHVLFS